MKKWIYILSSAITIFLVGCEKSMDRNPIDSISDATAFVSYQNYQTYAWGLYDYFDGYGVGSATPPVMTSQEIVSDNFMTNGSALSGYFTGSKSAPGGAGGATNTLAVAAWNFSYIRRVNLMLDHIDGSSMSQSDKDHWRSVGYFFRALRYYDMIAAFGDVVWLEHATYDTSASLYAPRTPRDSVAANMLSNLVWAESHIKTAGEGSNTINQKCVQFLISRFGLFEGTWRKYHGLSDANTYFNACVTYSEKLLTGATLGSLMSNYDDVYNTAGLVGKPGMILVKQYLPAGYAGSGGNSSNHQSLRYLGSNSANWLCSDVTKNAVESYLCTDGKPISTSTTYQGDDSAYAAFKNRDRRLYYTVVPPYRVKYKDINKTSTPGYSDTLWTNDTNPAWSAFIRLMNDTIGSVNKRLPVLGYSIDMKSGTLVPDMPHFKLYTNVQSAPTKLIDPVANYTGYYYWKLYNRIALTDGSNLASTNDCPVFRLEEVMLNYAEAKFETGAFTQIVADQTINLLRQRANPTSWPAMKMVVANINAAFDAKRDTDVDPVLWEIRRERRVELFGDGFRFNDIKRWAKGVYMTGQAMGVKVKNANYGNKLSIAGGAATGYVVYHPLAVGWRDAFYLEPIPTNEINLNPNLKQTPGYL